METVSLRSHTIYHWRAFTLSFCSLHLWTLKSTSPHESIFPRPSEASSGSSSSSSHTITSLVNAQAKVDKRVDRIF